MFDTQIHRYTEESMQRLSQSVKLGRFGGLQTRLRFSIPTVSKTVGLNRWYRCSNDFCEKSSKPVFMETKTETTENKDGQYANCQKQSFTLNAHVRKSIFLTQNKGATVH